MNNMTQQKDKSCFGCLMGLLIKLDMAFKKKKKYIYIYKT